VANKEKEETLKAIENSFKQSIEIITKKVMNKYRKENNINYELIKGYQLSELIENLDKKIIRPKEENFNIIDIFEKFIYGNTPLYTSCMKSFELFESVNNSTKILLIVSDGLLNDINNIEEAQKKIKEKIEDCEIITICIYLNSSNYCNQKQFYNEIQPQFDSGAKIFI
jgi:cell division GTPase FtsZ